MDEGSNDIITNDGELQSPMDDNDITEDGEMFDFFSETDLFENLDPSTFELPGITTVDSSEISTLTSEDSKETCGVYFGLIKHKDNKTWRAVIETFSTNTKDFPTWTDDIAVQVKQKLHQKGVRKWFVDTTPKNGNKRRRISAVSDNCWREATDEEFKDKTKARFVENRKERSQKQFKNRLGRPPNAEARHKGLPSNPQPLQPVICETCYPISENSVCFQWHRHPGTLKWLEVVKMFSDNEQLFPKWIDPITALVKAKLDEESEDVAFFRFRDAEGKPSISIHDGLWVQVLEEEIVENTKVQFLRNRKLKQVLLSQTRQQSQDGDGPHRDPRSPNDRADDSTRSSKGNRRSAGGSQSNPTLGGSSSAGAEYEGVQTCTATVDNSSSSFDSSIEGGFNEESKASSDNEFVVSHAGDDCEVEVCVVHEVMHGILDVNVDEEDNEASDPSDNTYDGEGDDANDETSDSDLELNQDDNPKESSHGNANDHFVKTFSGGGIYPNSDLFSNDEELNEDDDREHSRQDNDKRDSVKAYSACGLLPRSDFSNASEGGNRTAVNPLEVGQEIIQQKDLIVKRFETPPRPIYSLSSSLLSILSLGLMAWASFSCHSWLVDPLAPHQLHGASVLELLLQKPKKLYVNVKDAKINANYVFPGIAYRTERLQHQECFDESTRSFEWTLEHFRVSAIVALFGCLFELYLFVVGEPFRFKCNPFIKGLHQFREMSYSFVTSSSFFATICLTTDPDFGELVFCLRIFSFFLACALVQALYFGKIGELPFLLSAIQIFQLFIVLLRYSYVDDGTVTYTLAAHCAATAMAWFIQRSTPLRSACFHLLLTFSVLCQYVAVASTGRADPTFPEKIQEILYPTENTQILWVVSVFAGACGFVSTNLLAKRTYQAGRSMLSYIVWSTMHFVRFRRPLESNPYKLSDSYNGKCIRKLSLQPYSQRRFMGKRLAVPSVAGSLFPETWDIARKIDLLTTYLGHHFPQAAASTPIRDKVRMDIWEDGRNYYPSKLFSLSSTFPGRTLHSPPRPLENAFKEGRLLSYLCQYGIGTSFLQMARETESYPYFELTVADGDDEEPAFDDNPETGGLVLDFRDLEFFETKPDYEPYGGIAFFTFDESGLKLEWVVTPETQIRTTPDPRSRTFRRAESMIASSIYFQAVVGKLLVEINMNFNLLEVALQNAFDYDRNLSFPHSKFEGHPIRLILYIHLCNIIPAAELNVCHVLQEEGVFSQIWALTYDSLLNYINAQHDTFKLASDENWAYRKAAMAPLLRPLHGKTGFRCALQWELEYKDKIFDPYADDMVDAIYQTDEDVENDEALQVFFKSMQSLFVRVPKRYQGLRNKQGLKRFISETIYHLTIRHEVYRTGLSGALDPRVTSTQLPRDGGPPAVDEWRSLAFAALAATPCVDFGYLLQDGHANYGRDLLDIFDDATPVIAKHEPAVKLIAGMKAAFAKMQSELRRLQHEWFMDVGEVEPAEGSQNYMFYRPMPADISLGPGY